MLGDEALVTGQLVAMTDEGIIEPSDLAANTYRFRHALLRDAAYETQVLDVRSRNHAEVAEAIADRGASPHSWPSISIGRDRPIAPSAST